MTTLVDGYRGHDTRWQAVGGHRHLDDVPANSRTQLAPPYGVPLDDIVSAQV